MHTSRGPALVAERDPVPARAAPCRIGVAHSRAERPGADWVLVTECHSDLGPISRVSPTRGAVLVGSITAVSARRSSLRRGWRQAAVTFATTGSALEGARRWATPGQPGRRSASPTIVPFAGAAARCLHQRSPRRPLARSGQLSGRRPRRIRPDSAPVAAGGAGWWLRVRHQLRPGRWRRWVECTGRRFPTVPGAGKPRSPGTS